MPIEILFALHRIPETADEGVPKRRGTTACTGDNRVLESSTGRLVPSRIFQLVGLRAHGDNLM